jgi:CheY-like chemotaxis protein
MEYLEMIHGEGAEVRELAKSIYDSVEKGVDLINNLLHFARKGKGYPVIDLDLSDVIRKSHEIIERVFDKNIEIRVKVEKGLFVHGNQSLLSQVFMNLFTNARDAMPGGGVLSIEARKEGDKVIAVVSDTGHGMDKATLEKVFDPFFTLKEVGKGTGLGLSTTHGILEQHGGTISVSSEPGKGASFRIALPLVEPSELPKSDARRELIYGKGQKVLIVDDEPTALEALTNLARSLGYNTISVDRSAAALTTYETWSPDVVLMDRSMPEIDGIACMRKILERDPNAKIVIVSGYDESGPEGIDANTRSLLKGYVTKPCGLSDLSQAISVALRG